MNDNKPDDENLVGRLWGSARRAFGLGNSAQDAADVKDPGPASGTMASTSAGDSVIESGASGSPTETTDPSLLSQRLAARRQQPLAAAAYPVVAPPEDAVILFSDFKGDVSAAAVADFAAEIPRGTQRKELPKFKVTMGKTIIAPGAADDSIITQICDLGVLIGKLKTLRKMGLGENEPAVQTAKKETHENTVALFADMLARKEDLTRPQMEQGRAVGTPLLYAAAIGHAGLVDFIIKKGGADPTQTIKGPGLLPALAGITMGIPEKLDLLGAMDIGMPDVASFYRNAGIIMVPKEQDPAAFEAEATTNDSQQKINGAANNGSTQRQQKNNNQSRPRIRI